MARKAKKKKTVHWTKQPHAKLVKRCKSQELQIAKLKTQLAELRETKLLNERQRLDAVSKDPLSGVALDEVLERNAGKPNDGVGLRLMAHPRTRGKRVPADIDPNSLVTVDMDAEYTAEQVKEITGRFPWAQE